MPTSVSIERRRAAAQLIKSDVCGCGEAKRGFQPFCRCCWGRLTLQRKQQLLRMLKGSFVMIFEQTQEDLGHLDRDPYEFPFV